MKVERADFLEVLKTDPMWRNISEGELKNSGSLDFHFKEVNNRFKKLKL